MRSALSLRPGLPWMLVGALSLFLLVGCGDDDPSAPAGPTPISGQVTKGVVANSSVTVHEIGSDGLPASLVAGPFSTDAAGQWSGELPAGVAGPFLIVATGGSYVDEATGTTVNLGASRLLGYSAHGSGQVTPYTHGLALAAAADISAGSGVAAAWDHFVSRFESAFGFDPTTTAPGAAGSVGARTYLALLGGISELLANDPGLGGVSGAEDFDLVLALAADLSDGLLNGLDAEGEPVLVSTGSGEVSWPALDAVGIAALVDAINDFAAATEGLGDIVLDDIDLDFDGGGVGSGGGSVTFGGPGASLLSQTTFTPLTYSGNLLSLAWATASQSFSAQIGVSQSPNDASRSNLVTVTVQMPGQAYGWSVLTFEPGVYVQGVTISGDDVIFDGAVLPGTTNTELSLTVNGTLSAQ